MCAQIIKTKHTEGFYSCGSLFSMCFYVNILLY